MWTVSARRPPAADAPNFSRLPAPWRAAGAILTAAFPHDPDVWMRVSPGERIDLTALFADPGRPMCDRVLLAVAQAFIEGATSLPFGELVALSDARLQLVLDALAIARGGLPID